MFRKKEDSIALNKLVELQKQLEFTKQEIDEQFGDHVLSINDNTHELQKAMDYVYEVEQKVDKLDAKMEEISLMLSKVLGPENIILSSTEQKVFMVLYMFDGLMNASSIANRCNVDESVIKQCVFDMLSKDVRVVCEKVECVDYYKLDPHFKALQAKKGIVEISGDVKRELFNSSLNTYFVVDN